jgi:serine protease Do
MFRKLCLSTAALLAAALCMGGTAHAADDPSASTQQKQLQPLVQPSVVYESITFKGFVWDKFNKEYVGQDSREGGSSNARQFTVPLQCTGYVVNPAGWIATAGHCVDSADGKEQVTRAAIRWRMQQGFYKPQYSEDDLYRLLDFRVNTFDAQEKLHRNTVTRDIVVSWSAAVSGVQLAKSKPAFVRAFHKHDAGDAALLKVDESDLNAIPLGDSSKVEINDEVFAIGYPAVIDNYTDADLTPTFDSGTISSRKTVAHGLLPVLQMNADLSGGMSGGPTVTADGDVIGTNVSHFPGEAFNYSIPIDQVKELMDSTGVKNELSDTTKKYRAGISAYYAKDRASAIKNLKAVVDEQPGNGFASDFLKDAKALPKPKPKDNGSSALLFVGLGVLLLLLIVGGVLALVLSRRSKSPKPMAGPATAPGAPGGPGMVPGPMGGPAPPYSAPAPGAPVAPMGAPTGPAAPAAPAAPVGGGVPTAPTGYPAAPPVGDAPTGEPMAPVGFGSGAAPQGGPVPPAPMSPNGRADAPGEPGVGSAEQTAPVPATTAVSEGGPVGHHFCGNCGAKALENTKFCGECGAHL